MARWSNPGTVRPSHLFCATSSVSPVCVAQETDHVGRKAALTASPGSMASSGSTAPSRGSTGLHDTVHSALVNPGALHDDVQVVKHGDREAYAPVLFHRFCVTSVCRTGPAN